MRNMSPTTNRYTKLDGDDELTCFASCEEDPEIHREGERSFTILFDHENNRKIVFSWPSALRRQSHAPERCSLIITTRKKKRLLLYYIKSYFSKQRVDNNYIRKSRGNSISLKHENLSFMTIDLAQNFTIQRTYNNVKKGGQVTKKYILFKMLTLWNQFHFSSQ